MTSIANITINLPKNLNRDLNTFVMREASRKLNKVFLRIKSSFKQVISFYLLEKISKSPEYLSLSSPTGILKGEMGIVNHEDVLNQIVEAIKDASEFIVIPVSIKGPIISGGLQIGILKQKLEEVLSINAASFTSENNFAVDWLKWLLTLGDEIILLEYAFSAQNTPKSRTGLGVMVKGQGWRVPPEFSGTFSDNWLTRALKGVEVELEKYIIGQIRFGLE